jgi:SpoVK/Ycf46/Vps4 family AAA+-type ATPase
LLVGVPGCGKSLTAKAIATAWGIPLLRMDLGALKSKFVGESEANLRRAFRTIESVGRCVVWLDEVEKALAGATQGAADGGVSSDALGAILGWMQDRQGEAFVIATANDVSALPPELLRKGRWDEVWFVDLPTAPERVAVLEATLRTHGRKLDPVHVQAAASNFGGFSGAEIAALVPEALFVSFADGERDLTAQDIVNAGKNVVPLSKTSADKIARLKEWQQRCGARPATSPEAATKSTTVQLDL